MELNSSTPPTLPATSTVQGKVKLAADLAGSASAPTLANTTNVQSIINANAALAYYQSFLFQ